MRRLALWLGLMVLGAGLCGCIVPRDMSKPDCRESDGCYWNSQKHRCVCEGQIKKDADGRDEGRR